MIEINLNPSIIISEEVKIFLSPTISCLLDYVFQKLEKASTDEELLLWGNIWASLLYLRQEGLQPGFSQADAFAKKFILTNDLDFLIQSLYK